MKMEQTRYSLINVPSYVTIHAPLFLELAASSIKTMQCAMSNVRHTNHFRFFESMSLFPRSLLVLKCGCAHNPSTRWPTQDHALNLDRALIL